MEYTEVKNIVSKVCRLGLGTWSIGGWLWGGTDEKQAIDAIQCALDLGINLIDTAPVYGFGLAEEIVSKAILGRRDQVILATKAGLRWERGKIIRDSSSKRLLQEVEDSLRRLNTDYIDLYQVHWPDKTVPFLETAEVLQKLQAQGKIRAFGVSNYSAEMMKEFGECSTLQSPYNMFEREIEEAELPYCKEKGISILGYGAICRALLSGKMTTKRVFEGDDLRKNDPKFIQPRFDSYLACVEILARWAKEHYNKPVIALAIRYALDKGIDIPLIGCRKKEQLNFLDTLWDWKLSNEDLSEIEEILNSVANPVGPEFMAPKI
ncbi:MAG: Aldo-keto reductase YhdN [Chlamydiales bacterium]|nr:Aldo-keto reductase YhdN [Chlamydiales bacterium]MCH9619798.1 Aldo-keto reductase YhdN [Chlamydiales bacterium]MCH9623404.1 Aldo-keto reductase YhdN [Chlamydiales bacterium]